MDTTRDRKKGGSKEELKIETQISTIQHRKQMEIPILQTMLLIICVLTYTSTIIDIPIEVCFTVFSGCIIYIGSIKSLDQYSLKRDEESTQKSILSGLLSTTQMVWLFPMISSIFLMLAYATISMSIQRTFLMLFIGCTGTINLASTMRYLVIKFGAGSLDRPAAFLENIKIGRMEFRQTYLSLLCICVSGYITFLYFASGYVSSGGKSYHTTKNWILNNTLAMSFSVYFLDKLLVTNYKNAVIYLLGMMLYDIFWVFGSDVMVTVASQFDYPIRLLIPQAPGSVQMKFSILGIGDIALPGIYCAMMFRYDFMRHITASKESFTISNFESVKESLSFHKPYFTASVVGYMLGLLTTTTIYRLYSSAQPALLYINPFMLITTLLASIYWGEFKGLFHYDEDKYIEERQSKR
ncbi:unnamed protein product [Moneuplotes crassus]|uniref:Signal peptide peptidase n=1 Tax=Euplotes crassus TaxID=5936 RepID=A0AAD1XDN1_EUPCR|nr:unnamed protein product [Moneuplotes crassus]